MSRGAVLNGAVFTAPRYAIVRYMVLRCSFMDTSPTRQLVDTESQLADESAGRQRNHIAELLSVEILTKSF